MSFHLPTAHLTSEPTQVLHQWLQDPGSGLGFCSEVRILSPKLFTLSLYVEEFLGMMEVSYCIGMNDDDAPPPYTSLPSGPLDGRPSHEPGPARGFFLLKGCLNPSPRFVGVWPGLWLKMILNLISRCLRGLYTIVSDISRTWMDSGIFMKNSCMRNQRALFQWCHRCSFVTKFQWVPAGESEPESPWSTSWAGYTHFVPLNHKITTPLDLKVTWSLCLTCFEAFSKLVGG